MSLSNLLALLQHISARPSANSPPSLHNTSALSQPTSPLIIYLPPIGTHLRSQYPPIPSFLRTPFAALAQINYRWNLPLSSTTNPSPKLLSSHPSYANHPFPDSPSRHPPRLHLPTQALPPRILPSQTIQLQLPTKKNALQPPRNLSPKTSPTPPPNLWFLPGRHPRHLPRSNRKLRLKTSTYHYLRAHSTRCCF